MEEYHYEAQGTEQWRVIGGAVVLAVIIAAALWYFLVFRQPETQPVAFEQPGETPATDALASPAVPTPTASLVAESTPTSAAYVPPQAPTGANGYEAPETAGTYDVAPTTPTGSGLMGLGLAVTAAAAGCLSWQLTRRGR